MPRLNGLGIVRCLGQEIRAYADSHQIDLNPKLRRQIRAGFGDRAEGEDAFDAAVALLAMIAATQRPYVHPPLPADELRVEGWMFGHSETGS